MSNDTVKDALLKQEFEFFERSAKMYSLLINAIIVLVITLTIVIIVGAISIIIYNIQFISIMALIFFVVFWPVFIVVNKIIVILLEPYRKFGYPLVNMITIAKTLKKIRHDYQKKM